jgi:protein-L-isoaspartate(D-aspartate) O-methyltransferase
VAEWLRSGLQIRARRFDSGRGLHLIRVLTAMIDFERARKAMVDNQLRTSAITDRRLLAAMGQVPREIFVPEPRRSLAYIDEAHVLPGPAHRALPPPAPFAQLVQLGTIGPEDSVLDVGAGNGYSSAVLAQLAGRVIALESDVGLAAEARENLAAVGAHTVTVIEGPLDAGAPEQGPYDAILIEGAVREVPHKLFDQLKQGGRLVALIKQRGTPVAHVFVRSGDEFAGRAAFNANLPPLRQEPPAEEFVF